MKQTDLRIGCLQAMQEKKKIEVEERNLSIEGVFINFVESYSRLYEPNYANKLKAFILKWLDCLGWSLTSFFVVNLCSIFPMFKDLVLRQYYSLRLCEISFHQQFENRKIYASLQNDCSILVALMLTEQGRAIFYEWNWKLSFDKLICKGLHRGR